MNRKIRTVWAITRKNKNKFKNYDSIDGFTYFIFTRLL